VEFDEISEYLLSYGHVMPEELHAEVQRILAVVS
jgi:hypothetical protein